MASMLVSVVGQHLVTLQTLVGTECFGHGCNLRELKMPYCIMDQQSLRGLPLHFLARLL